MAHRFEELIVWQKAFALTKGLYEGLKNCRDWGYKSQVQRASVSIMSNIAEGNARNTRKEFAHFLSIARGSCDETRSLLYVAQGLNYLDSGQSKQLFDLVDQIGRMLYVLLKSIQT